MELRKAKESEIPALAELYQAGAALLKSKNINQWQNGYPNAESAATDIANQCCYVLAENGLLAGTACIAFGQEPTYHPIHKGTWQAQPEIYGFLHRVTISPDFAGKGLAGDFFRLAEKLAAKRHIHVLRCDTHPDNLAMQKTLTNNGYTKRGIIYLENGDMRLAYEKLL